MTFMDRRRRDAERRVLRALIDSDDLQAFAYPLSKQTGLRSGRLYPALRRLENGGLVMSGWETYQVKHRPRRRWYRITAKGSASVLEDGDG